MTQHDDMIACRHNSFVEAWIADYQSDSLRKHADCHSCGWPHAPNLLCGMGSTFGRVRLGGKWVYVDASNVAWTLKFVQGLGGDGWHHWRDEVFFRKTVDGVEAMHLEFYNNRPSTVVWAIPRSEWETIAKLMA